MDLLTVGFPLALSAENLLFCFVGVALGTAVGVLPGIGPLAAIAMLLPVTFYLEPVTALIMLAGVYYGAEYGGSTASILLNVPGTPSNAITALDGFPMSKQGRAGIALLITAVASFVGGVIGIVVLMVLTPLLIELVVLFGPGEYFAAMLFGLLAAASIGSSGPLKGMAMVMAGLLLGCIGLDVNTGIARYTFGYYELYDGIHIAVLAIGLFGVTEIIASIGKVASETYRGKVTFRSMIPTREDRARSLMPMVRGSGIGSLFGALPGVGTMLAAFTAYLVEKRASSVPNQFGRGAIEGVAAPEAANNAAAQTAFIPTLTMGIPGSATMAVMLGALIIHGITPGPLFVNNHPDVFWGLIASFWIGNVLLLVLNIPLVGLWVKLLQVPYHLLYPLVIVLICAGVYSLHNNVFDIALVALVGAVGYGLRLMDFEPAPLLLAFILGPLMEVNLRRALLLSQGDFTSLLRSPISGALLALCFLILLWMLLSLFRTTTAARRGV